MLECRSVRPANSETEIPTGIELRQVNSGQLLAYLVPVVKTVDREVRLSPFIFSSPVLKKKSFYCDR